MEDKRKNLKDSRQRVLLDELMQKLSSEHPSFYYLSAVEIAHELYLLIQDHKGMSQEDYKLLAGLSRGDIQILLSIHH